MRRFLCALALPCLFFGAWGQGLKVGDRVPGGVLAKEMKGRLVIVDFWATWCGPCRAAVPRLDSLQRVMGDRVLVLPVTYESEAVVAPVLAELKKLYGPVLPGLTGDKAWHRLFPHVSLPHVVWIGGDGVVKAITEYKELTVANLEQVLAGRDLGLRAKVDVRLPYDKGRGLFVGGNGGDGSLALYRSVLSGYVPGLPAGIEVSAFDKVQGQRFSARDVPLSWVYRLAFGEGGRSFGLASTKLLTRDSARFTSLLSGQVYLDWLAAGNGYCYELALPPALADSGFAFLQQDLRRLFPAYRASVEHLPVPCLVLERLAAEADLPRTAGGEASVSVTPFGAHLRNVGLDQLLKRLDRQYLQGLHRPVLDGTGYTGRVDLDISCPLNDVAALNKALAPYRLQFVFKDHLAEMLVIRDNLKP